MKLCILGMGSYECKTLENNLKDILRELDFEGSIDMSDDIDLFLQYGINKTPALLIDEVLVHNDQLQDLTYLKTVITEILNKDDNYHKAS